MILKLYIENDLLDLFQDESIELNSSIANVNDISKNTTDYAKSFTVPATSNNNRIFRHYYDANIDNAFDARVKQSGRIELDGMPFRTGKWQLEKVILKKGNPSSYSINFVGNLVSLKDKLGNDELSTLPLTAFDHDYNAENVKTYLQTSGDLIYNLLVKTQLYYNSVDATIIPNATNIAYNSGAGFDWKLLKPSIRLIKIIEAIETKYSVVFSRDFFGSTEFNNLFFWINNDANLTGISDNSVRIDFTNTGSIYNGGSVNITDDTFVAGGKRIYGIVRILPSAGYESVPYNVERKIDGENNGWYSNLVGNFDTVWAIERNNPAKHSWVVSSNYNFKFTSTLIIEFDYESYNESANFPEQTITANFQIKNNLPKIKIIDFLKGLFSMFKLVVISDDNENLYIDTINNYYAKGSLWNISRYVKTDTQEVSRGNLLNEITFKFKEPTTILNKQFKVLTGQGYGDEETKLTDTGLSDGKPLEGSPLTIEVPFEQFIYERLPDLADNSLTNVMYGAVVDDKIAPVNPAPHIFYNINTTIGAKTIGYLNGFGVKEELTGNINTPSHSIDWLLPQFNLTFGRENNEWTNTSNNNTLYFNYYKNYVESIFNIKRRTFKYSAVLPLRILLQLQLNDILEIKNNYYRIDNFNLNLLTRDVTLNLINAFDTIINNFSANVTSLFADYTAQTQSVSVPNIGNSTVSLTDNSWLTATIVGTNVFFDFAENIEDVTRNNLATITNLETLQTIEISITQTGIYIPSLRFFSEKNSQYLNTIIS